MKHLSISLMTLLLSMGVWSTDLLESETLTFGVVCKVLDQELMNMEEGKSNRYSHLEDSLENGDSFYLEWEITEMWKGADLGMFVRAGRKEDNTQLQWFYMNESSYQERFPWNFYFDSSKEGNMVLGVLDKLTKANIPSVTIFDSFIFPKKYEKQVKKIMYQERNLEWLRILLAKDEQGQLIQP